MKCSPGQASLEGQRCQLADAKNPGIPPGDRPPPTPENSHSLGPLVLGPLSKACSHQGTERVGLEEGQMSLTLPCPV